MSEDEQDADAQAPPNDGGGTDAAPPAADRGREGPEDGGRSEPARRGPFPGAVIVTGAAGFLGRNIAAGLVREKAQVRAFVRPSHDDGPLRERGCEIVTGDITDPATLTNVMDGCGVCVHCVGILRERRPQGVTFERIHVEGAGNVVSAAAAGGVQRFVHISALGTREKAATRYHATKFEGEAVVRASGLDALILRPSVVFGPGDGLSTRLLHLIDNAPVVVPVVGQGGSRLQPIFIDDLVACVVRAATDRAVPAGVYDLGGPDVVYLIDLIDLLMHIRGRSRVKLHLLKSLMYLVVPLLESFLADPPLTMTELRLMNEDTICPVDENNRILNGARKLMHGSLMRLEEGLRTYVSAAAPSGNGTDKAAAAGPRE